MDILHACRWYTHRGPSLYICRDSVGCSVLLNDMFQGICSFFCFVYVCSQFGLAVGILDLWDVWPG